MNNFKVSKQQSAIIKTLAYSDIFDYPLTDREVANYLISDSPVERKTVQKELKIIADNERLPAGKAGILTDGEFYFLKGREKIVELRKKREKWSEEKIKIARQTADRLKIIPTIRMIGITGALAMKNCQEEDDIDLLIITSANTLWVTRFLIIVLCPLLGIKRRKRGETKVKNKICFNLFLDENHLKVGPESLFLAHEVCQVRPIFDKGRIYERLLDENKWVEKYLPNAFNHLTIQPNNHFNGKKLMAKWLNGFMVIAEKLAFYFQYQYMKSKITCEKVSRYQAFFHPKDLNDKIQREFERRIKSFKED